MFESPPQSTVQFLIPSSVDFVEGETHQLHVDRKWCCSPKGLDSLTAKSHSYFSLPALLDCPAPAGVRVLHSELSSSLFCLALLLFLIPFTVLFTEFSLPLDPLNVDPCQVLALP